MALDFPSSPTVNQKYPASPVAGVPTYTWDGEKWTTVGGSMPGVGGGDPPGTATPLGDITPAVVGVATKYAREDHRHPVDTSIANKVDKAGGTMTGDLFALTKPPADRTTAVATTAFVNQDQIILNGVDLNTITAPGTYACQGAANNPNEPGGTGQWYLHVITYGGSALYTVQIAWSLPTSSVVEYTRVQVNGTWYPWVATYNANTLPIATAAEYLANTANRVLSPNGAWSAAAPVVSGTSASLTPDFSTAIDFQWTYSSTTAAVNNGSNLKVGQKGVIYIIAGSAGCVITTWGSQYKFPGGTKPTMSLTNGAIDAISYTILSSTQILCSFQGAFA